jgi:hypothetical protein
VGAAVVRLTLQESVPGDAREEALQATEFKLRTGALAAIVSEEAFEVPLYVPVRLTVPEDKPGDTLTLNWALVSPVATITVVGTDTPELLLVT